MFTVITVVACLKAMPAVCQSFPAVVTTEDGRPMSYFECLGVGGQAYLKWFRENHPDHEPKKVRCTLTNDLDKAMSLLEDQPA